MPNARGRAFLTWALSCGEANLLPEEPSDALYYFGTDDTKLPGVAERFTNMSRDEFDSWARSGVPFVIADGLKDLPMNTWSCDVMQEKFKGVKLRREYGRGEANKHKFEGSWTTEKVKIKGRKLPADAPQYAPFYSDLVKAWRGEEERGWGDRKAVLAMESEIKQATKVPYFMDASNIEEMRTNPEFWLQPPETGSMAHMDEHCISTIASTISGVKRWRFQPIPKSPHPEGYFDGLVYERDEWQPIFELETRPGESVIFPPGMIHEGKSVGEDCVSSITFQFAKPLPVHYFRTFLPRLRRTADMRGCMNMIAQMATLGVKTKPKKREVALKDGQALAEELDANKDGTLSRQEIENKFSGGRQVEVADVLAYHDSNKDGVTTTAEFAANYADWCAVEWKARKDKVVFRDDL